jgi:hypothetical protein
MKKLKCLTSCTTLSVSGNTQHHEVVKCKFVAELVAMNFVVHSSSSVSRGTRWVQQVLSWLSKQARTLPPGSLGPGLLLLLLHLRQALSRYSERVEFEYWTVLT